MQSTETPSCGDINRNNCDSAKGTANYDAARDEIKERQRVTKACDNCRKKKIKCDADGDACSSCKMLQVPCLFLDPTKKRGPPKGSARNITALEDRLHRMEALLGGLVREAEPPLMWDSPPVKSLAHGSRDPSETDPQYPYDVQQQHWQQQLHTKEESGQTSQTSQTQSQTLRNPEEHVCNRNQHTQQQQHQELERVPHQQSRAQNQSLQQLLQQQQLRQPFSTESSQSPDTLRSFDSSNESAMISEPTWQNNPYQAMSSPSPVMEHSGVDPSPTSLNLPRLGATTPPTQDLDGLEEDVGHLSLDRTGHERYVGKSSPLFYSQGYYGTSVLVREPEAQKFLRNPDLPSPETITHLLNLHFTFVHPFAPVLVWSKFLRRLRSKEYTPSFLFLLNCIFALSARYSEDISFRTDPNLPETVGVVFAEKAKRILDTLYVSPDLDCIAGLVLLAFQQMGTGGGYRAWMYVGIAVRMAQHLGLNRNCRVLKKNMSVLDREERDRIWWSCYLSDRFLSASFGRPQAINEHDVDATYPEGIDEENTPLEILLEGAVTKLTGPQTHSERNFVYLASLMRIQGRVMVSLYSPLSKASSTSTTSMTNPAPLEQLDKELTDWLLTLPEHLQFRSVQQESGTFVCMLHLTFYSILILLHRPYSHQANLDLQGHTSMSFNICTSAANNAIEIASNMLRSANHRGVTRIKGLLHNSVFILFTAGIVHITNCTSSDPTLAASARLRTIETMRCMDALEEIWLTARYTGENLRSLLRMRNIDLFRPFDDFKKQEADKSKDVEETKEAKTAQPSSVASASKDQFEFDVNQIMGYYQGSGYHEESSGRNSRHFTPTPYYSSSAPRHHGPLGTHPGLSHGHSQQLRRPRQTKITSPPTTTTGPPQPFSSGYSFSTPSITIPANVNFLPTLGSAGLVPGSSANTPDQFINTMSPSSISTPSPTAAEAVNSLQHHSGIAPSNPLSNPFASSLWGIPTSVDNDEWMLYMQSGGGMDTAGALGVDVNQTQAQTLTTLDQSSDIYSSLVDMDSSVPTMNNSGAQVNPYSARNRGGAHPLAQSLTRNEIY
ncbi:hypothetical protein EMPS_05356 [Entomortierella parvispora]|uniref:Zn(2)-C6 fungal-type domain-containing protein n=1 Tax=Entomortierella parvispora TaxID=205924 RepID=A0A9P3LWE6_9FUNG|nr:hypothetical protein EMPS_05356 [Entomortierella parvispora]